MNSDAHKQRGFTLLEMMVVLVILGILASLVVPSLMGNKDKADHQKAVSDIVALVEKPTASPIPENYNAKGYIKRLPQDPWGNEYLLVSPGEHGDYDILSAGQDGEPGTADDITNWELGKAK